MEQIGAYWRVSCPKRRSYSPTGRQG